MIEICRNTLTVSFPEVHPDAKCSVEFQRTLRVPDDNQEYPLPAGLGRFPIFPVDDFPVPADWKTHGGVFLPMYQSEALWIKFSTGSTQYPFAIKVAAGKINAVDGSNWHNDLQTTPQDYVVIPEQRWLDGFCVAKNAVRQFVAMPLGQGMTAEEQITGAALWGGLQFIFYPMKAAEYLKRDSHLIPIASKVHTALHSRCVDASGMGLAPGGRIKQKIASDPYGLDVWETSAVSRCFVHLANSDAFETITGDAPPTRPITPDQYAAAKLPWFDYYSEGNSVEGSNALAQMDGLGAAYLKSGKSLDNNAPINFPSPHILNGLPPKPVARDPSIVDRSIEMLCLGLMRHWQHSAPADNHQGILDGREIRNTQVARLVFILEKIAAGNVEHVYSTLCTHAQRRDGESYISKNPTWMTQPISLSGGWYIEGCMSLAQKKDNIIQKLEKLGFTKNFRAAIDCFIENKPVANYLQC